MGVPWSLYAAHSLSTWGDNMWWFAGAVVLMIMMMTTTLTMTTMKKTTTAMMTMMLILMFGRWLLHAGAPPLVVATHCHLWTCHCCIR